MLENFRSRVAWLSRSQASFGEFYVLVGEAMRQVPEVFALRIPKLDTPFGLGKELHLFVRKGDLRHIGIIRPPLSRSKFPG